MPLPFIGILSCCLSSMIVIRPGILCLGWIGTPTVLQSLDCWWWFPRRLNGLLWRRRTRERTEKLVMEVVGIAMWLVEWVACLGGILYFLRSWIGSHTSVSCRGWLAIDFLGKFMWNCFSTKHLLHNWFEYVMNDKFFSIFFCIIIFKLSKFTCSSSSLICQSIFHKCLEICKVSVEIFSFLLWCFCWVS